MSTIGAGSIPLRLFFDRYAELSLKGEPQELAALYATSFLAAGPQGSRIFANDSRFIDWLVQVRDSNRKSGMRSLTALAVHDVALSQLHTLATVRWGARFAKTGTRLIEFEISYLLEKAGHGWTILGYVSQRDQQDEMKKLGLL